MRPAFPDARQIGREIDAFLGAWQSAPTSTISLVENMLDKSRYFSLIGVQPLVLLFLVVTSIAGATDPSSFDSTAQTEAEQTEALRHRLESLRSRESGVTLSFTRLNQSFLVHHTPMALRLGGCTFDVAKGMSGLIDILLGAKIKVGYPAGSEKYQPEARFGVYIGVDLPEGLDLWFSNPLNYSAHDQWVVGQSHDRGEVTAYRIMAAPTLRNALWDWAHANGYPRQNTAAECQDMLKDNPPRQAARH